MNKWRALDRFCCCCYRSGLLFFAAGNRTKKIEDSLIKLLNDEDRLVRESACLSLGHMKSSQGIPHIVDLWWVVQCVHVCCIFQWNKRQFFLDKACNTSGTLARGVCTHVVDLHEPQFGNISRWTAPSADLCHRCHALQQTTIRVHGIILQEKRRNKARARGCGARPVPNRRWRGGTSHEGHSSSVQWDAQPQNFSVSTVVRSFGGKCRPEGDHNGHRNRSNYLPQIEVLILKQEQNPSAVDNSTDLRVTKRRKLDQKSNISIYSSRKHCTSTIVTLYRWVFMCENNKFIQTVFREFGNEHPANLWQKDLCFASSRIPPPPPQQIEVGARNSSERRTLYTTISKITNNDWEQNT